MYNLIVQQKIYTCIYKQIDKALKGNACLQ